LTSLWEPLTGRMKNNHTLNGLGVFNRGRVVKLVPRKALMVLKAEYPYPKPTQVGR
jgi:hypothetical protein